MILYSFNTNLIFKHSKDPWEVAIRNDKEKKRKGKHTSATSSTEETRNSLRVKLNQMVGATEAPAGGSDLTKPPVKAKTGIQFLIDQFPYSSLSDLDVVNLYDISGFKLGDNLEDSIQIVLEL